VTKKGKGNLRKVYSKLYKLIDNFKIIYPEKVLWNIVISLF
jgi:hypothetical protein